MRIKRFIAPDIRSALRMVRDEQGAEAVILSNRTTADGIEIVAATDYDEALVQQALRTAGAESRAEAAPAASAAEASPQAAAFEPVLLAQRGESVSWSARAEAVAREPALAATAAPERRAVFHIDERPTAESRIDLAQARAEAAVIPSPIAEVAAPAHVPAVEPVAEDATDARPAPSRFEMMMAALTRQYVVAPTPAAEAAPIEAVAPPAIEDRVTPASEAARIEAPSMAAAAATPARAPAAFTPAAFVASTATATAAAEAPVAADATATVTAPPAQWAIEPIEAAPAETLDPTAGDATAPALAAVPTAPATDPTVVAMREELGLMRRMIERELGQLAGERLRGSASRALAMDLLLDYGCTQALAQAVAERIDPNLDPARVPPVMLAALAQMIPVLRDEPIERGGVIALVGPTGAGKTTTAAKLAARFAARHSTRDVALVTTDHHRTGAREQLQGFGRRLGITVCEAAGPEALADTLQQVADYPLVLVDTAGYAGRDRALGSQLAWLRTTQGLRSLLVLPANGNPLDLADIARRYRGLRPEGAVLTKIDETGRLGAALSVLLENELRVAYTCHGQQVPTDLESGDASNLVLRLEKLRRAADNPLVNEDRHAIA
ncbi:AAA family ATPase [Lysobacter olei]